LLLVAALGVDFTLYDASHSLFLGRKFIDLSEAIKIWR